MVADHLHTVIEPCTQQYQFDRNDLFKQEYQSIEKSFSPDTTLMCSHEPAHTHTRTHSRTHSHSHTHSHTHSHSHTHTLTTHSAHKKTEALSCFQHYVDWLRTEGVEVGPGCALQSDNDGVYRGDEFASWCRQQGIRQQFSAPHTQAQNGIAERNWRTINDTARTMLTAAQLPTPYWGLAVQHAATVRNMVPSAALGGDVPCKRLLHVEPDYERLQPFGCAAYVHVEDDARSKWAPKARKGICLLYTSPSPRDRTRSRMPSSA